MDGNVTNNRFATTRDGVSIAYSLHEKSKGAPRVALVHSLALDRSFWQPVIEKISGETSILAMDCRGNGASDRAAGPYSVAQFAHDLADTMDAAGWPDAVVAGASMGGSVALAFAMEYPERITGLGLFDTTAWYGPGAPQAWSERAAKAQAGGMDSLAAFQAERWFSDAFRASHPEVLEKMLAVFRATDVNCYAELCSMLGSFDLRDGLAGIRVPTAIMVGEEDFATPVAMSRAMHEAIAGSSIEVLERGRHLTPLEQPDRIAAALLTLTKKG